MLVGFVLLICAAFCATMALGLFMAASFCAQLFRIAVLRVRVRRAHKAMHRMWDALDDEQQQRLSHIAPTRMDDEATRVGPPPN
jgi:hypothetical protein